MYQEAKFIKGLGLFLLIGFTLSSCAPTSFTSPNVSLDLSIENVDGEQSSTIMASSSELDEDEIATITPKAFYSTELCFILNITGSGLARDFVDSTATSCDNSFPGLGKMSDIFKLGEQPKIDISYGQRRFDLIAFPKSYFGESCPKTIEVKKDGLNPVAIVADGKSISFPTGSNKPVSIASTVVQLQPGRNAVGLKVKKLQSTSVVGTHFGCRSFQVFPSANSLGYLDTGLKQMFFDVECPMEATHVKATSADGAQSDLIECSTQSGKAFIKNFALTTDEITASEYDWYYPQVSVAAYAGTVKVDSKKLKVRLDNEGLYKSLGTSEISDPSWREFASPISDPGDRFAIGSVDSTKIVFFSQDNTAQTFRYEVALNQGKYWDGNAAQLTRAATHLFSNPVAKKAGYFLSLDGSGRLAVQKCFNTADCSSDWAGVIQDRSPASISSADLFGAQNKIKVLSLVLDGGHIIAELVRTTSQNWLPEGYASAMKETWADQNHFYPAWRNPEISFVKVLNYTDTRLSESFQTRTHLLAGGTVAMRSVRQSVLYRSPDSGRNWYLVYQGPEDSKPLDAITFKSASDEPGFVILESVGQNLRILKQDTHTWGF